MEDEFYAIIKLISGEEIMALVSVDNENDDPILIVQKPVIMHVHNHGPHSFIKVKPWMELPDEDIFIIRLDKVITMTESNDKKLINVYNHYLNEDDPVYKENGLMKPNSQMGYISSVEDARRNLEKTFKLNKET